MGVVREMTAIAAECARSPRRVSVWSERLGRYACSKDPEFQAAVVQGAGAPAAHAPISPAFKLVFLSATGGTLLFVLICVVTTFVAGKEPPALLEKTISSLFDLAKIGFGAVAGLLGGQALRA